MNSMINQIPYLDLVEQPEQEPLTVAEVKQALSIDSSGEDAPISSLIKAARIMAEEYLKRSLITQSWQLQYDLYAPSVIVLPRGPVQSITYVKIIARDWSEQVLDSSTYYLNAGKEHLIFDAAPMGQIIQIQYITGYGDAEDVSESIKQGMLNHIINMYNNPTENKSLPSSYLKKKKRYVMQPNGFNGLTLVIISLLGIVTSLFWIAGLLLIVD